MTWIWPFNMKSAPRVRQPENIYPDKPRIRIRAKVVRHYESLGVGPMFVIAFNHSDLLKKVELEIQVPREVLQRFPVGSDLVFSVEEEEGKP